MTPPRKQGPDRRRLLAAGLAAPLLFPRFALAQPGMAQPGAAQPIWPDRPVRLVVPYAAGGPTDAVARLLAETLSNTLPQRVVVENRAGGGALPGTEAVARAPKDGGTLLFTTVVHAVHRALHGSRLTFDPAADFVPVAVVGVVPMVILVPPDSPYRDLPALIAALKQNPQPYGSSGVGGSSHLGVELLKSMTGIRTEHIPYRGTGPAVTDLPAGRLALVMDSVATGAAQVKAGALRGLATTGARRSSALPDLPTVAETVPGFEATTWNAILAPSGTDPAVLEAQNAAVNRALSDPALQAKLAGLGVEVPPPEGRGRRAAAEFVASETRKWEALIREAGIQPE